MSSKVLSIIIFILLQIQFTYCQFINIDLSITWETKYDVFTKDSLINAPKLNITYFNASDTSYYFLKLSDNMNGLPKIYCDINAHPYDYEEYINWRHDYIGRAKKHQKYTNINYHVLLGGNPSFANGWEVINDSTFFVIQNAKAINDSKKLGTEPEIESDIINCDLQDIYEYILHENKNGYIDRDYYFSLPEITIDNILNTLKDQFIFLRPNEIYVDTYNLIGFKLVEGCFTFIINQNSAKSYVVNGGEWDSSNSQWIEQVIELPMTVDEYLLYSGKFNSNKISICF